MRQLTNDEIKILKKNGCAAEKWENISVAEGFDANFVRQVQFYGKVQIGALQKELLVGENFNKHASITNATLRDVSIGDDCLIENIHCYINNYLIGNDCFICNVDSIETTADASFGEGKIIPVLNEVGEGNVMLCSGLNSQLAALMVKYEQDTEFMNAVQQIIRCEIEEKRKSVQCGTIHNRVRIVNTGRLQNCHIGSDCIVNGAQLLRECTLKSMPGAAVKIGTGVIVDDCVIYNGSKISNNAKLEGCFVGEACTITDGFTAENSLFFTNCYMANGEACAAFCGPFSASHHKCTLLIGGQYSFYNAGSNTNFSNHAYKMGPIHWGILERGSKTASGSYILLPAQIGTFSVCFGKIMHHPDTRKLPFSYLIAYGEQMFLVPGRNLTTVGLYRDIRKWPKRDKRHVDSRNSVVNFDWLSPFSVCGILEAKRTLEALLQASGDVETYNYHDYVIKNSSLKKGLKYYDIALRIFMGAVMKRHRLVEPSSPIGKGDWSDLSGLLLPLSEEQRIVSDIRAGKLTTTAAIRDEFVRANENYAEYRWTWSYRCICDYYGLQTITEQDAQRIQEDYIAARRSWIAEIKKDAKKEYQLGDVQPTVLESILKDLDKEVEFERLKYDM